MLLGDSGAAQPVLDMLQKALSDLTTPEFTRTVLEQKVESVVVASLETEMLDGSQVRALMLELIRRSAHDWVLYRNSSRLEQRSLAHDAYVWLFEEKPGHPWWKMRKDSGKELTSLICICDVLDIEVETVRDSVRSLTPKKIKTAGRPPERRKRQSDDHGYYDEYSLSESLCFGEEAET